MSDNVVLSPRVMVSDCKETEKVAPVACVTTIRQPTRKIAANRIPLGIRSAIPLVFNQKDDIQVVIFLHAAVMIRKCQFVLGRARLK